MSSLPPSGSSTNTMGLYCATCEHTHNDDGTCGGCACQAELQLNQLCDSCGHAAHMEKPCQCGCDG